MTRFSLLAALAIGSHLVDRLLAEGNKIVVVDNFSNSDRSEVPDEAELVKGDLTESDFVSEVITSEFDGVFYLTTRKLVSDENLRRRYGSNGAMTQNVLEAMDNAGVSDIAFTSSSTVYGNSMTHTRGLRATPVNQQDRRREPKMI